MKTTGKLTYKVYRCTHCGDESSECTNHYGEIYSSCKSCSWKRPMQATIKVCEEPVPEGMGVPEPWKIVKLRDVTEIIS